MTPELGKRAARRREMDAAIRAAARAQLVERGAAALSLREVARSLGVASSAVYRYVDSRDALLTMLLVDAYTGLADAVDATLATAAAAPVRERVRVLAEAMLAWADGHRAEWGLIYGAPVPGYAAPEASTTAPGTRVMRRLGELAHELEPRAMTFDGEYSDYLDDAIRSIELDLTRDQAAWVVRTWCLIAGTISMVLFGQLGPEPPSSLHLAREMLRVAVEQAG